MNFPTSQTPPPPAPGQQAVPVMPPEPAGPGLSEAQRLVNTFIAPSKTFDDIRRNARWWVPFVLLSVSAIAFFVMIDKKVGFDEVARTMLANNKGIQQLSPDQQELAISRTAKGLKIGEYVAPIFVL